MRIAILIAVLLGGFAVAATAATPRTFLAVFDSDRDGRVSLSEYQTYMEAGFRRMDANGDGVLDVHEVPSGPRRHDPLTLAAHRRHVAAQFHRQDSNDDGYLSARELVAPPR